MNSRIIISVAATLLCSVSFTVVVAKTKPLTIINATGKEICVSWGHSDQDLKTVIHCLGIGGDSRDIKEWDTSEATYLFIAVKNLSNPEPNPGKAGTYLFKGYTYQIKSQKTVNVKIVSRKVGSQNLLLVEPNATFGDLKEVDIFVVPEKGDPRTVKQIKHDGLPSKSLIKMVFNALIED